MARDLGRADHAAGGGRVGDVQRDDVGVRQKIVEADAASALAQRQLAA